jgi:hypothetical protein
MGLQGPQVLKGDRVLKVLKGRRVFKVLKGLKVLWGGQVPKEI